MASSSSHYDVFLSFRDDEKLKGGQAITPTLVTAVENSTASVVLLSENYASSSWCLEELVKMSAGEQRDRGFFQFSIRSIHQMWGIKGGNLEKPWLNMKRIWRIGRCILEGMDEPSRKSIDDASPNDIMRDLIKLTAEIRALIELIGPDDDAIVRDLTQIASEISALMKLIGPLDDAVVRDLIRLASEVEARMLSIIPNDNGIVRRFVWVQKPSKAHGGSARFVRQGKLLSKVSGQQLYANASILILILDSWNLLYVLLLQSCEDVFHGSPVTIFCKSKLSDLRSCEVGRFGNPLNWGDGVVREVVLAEVVGEEAGKGKTLRMEDFEDRR
ncbi:hypothetical protein AAG906_006567 [Vitis piasezkii]